MLAVPITPFRQCALVEIVSSAGTLVDDHRIGEDANCVASDSAVLAIGPGDSVVRTMWWWGDTRDWDWSHRYPDGAAEPAGEWSATVTLGGSTDRRVVADIAFKLDIPGFLLMDRRARVERDSVAVGDSVRFWVGLHNTTDRPIRIVWPGGCVAIARFIRSDGVNVAGSFGCTGAGFNVVYQPGDSIVNTGMFRATGPRATPGTYYDPVFGGRGKHRRFRLRRRPGSARGVLTGGRASALTAPAPPSP